MNANDILTENVVTVNEATSIRDAVELLQTLEIRHLPVLGSDRQLVGMLSDRDVRNSATPYTLERESPGEEGGRVVDVMTSDVVSVTRETDLDEIIDLILENRIGAVPVVEPSTSELVGIVSYIDVLRALRGAA
jgi:acetoin utilization protein AcuB